MAVNFPSNPTNGQTITASGITYAYDSTQGVWSDSPQGLTQAIDALTDVDTSTSAPTNGQTLQWNSTDGEWQPADSSAGVTVYATIDDLPLTGIAEGSMALVDSTDKLYIFSDSGWYSISIVNTTPSISGVSTAYTLATDGTATTITVSATDPEGLPLTYSIVSDTSGNVATVAQGTGSNTNQWTITPTTNTANGGNFTLVFRASDGVNIASASSTFSLVFTLVIPNSQYTTALITSVGANNAVNNSFDDASTNNHTITASGDVTQNTFSPYRSGGYSTYFDGSGDYLQPAGTTIFDISSSTATFTVEAWIYPTTMVAGSAEFRFASIISKGAVFVNFGYKSDGTLRFYTYNGSQNYINSTSTGVVEAGRWQHVAVVSNAGSVTLYVDGSSVGTGTLAAPSASGVGVAPKIGAADTGQSADFVNGYIADLRVIDGSAVTPSSGGPTERLTAVTNTSLLTCHLPYIADGSTNSHAITVNGNTKPEPFAPYEYLEYDSTTNGGSMHFDGGGDYLSIADDASFTIGNGDFTAECWVYPTASPNQPLIFGQWSNPYSWAIQLSNDGNRNARMIFHDGNFKDTTTSTPVALNAWTHLALVKNGSTATIYVNGVSAGTYTIGTLTDSSSALTIGALASGGQAFQGSIVDVRLVKGTAVYTSAFTPPTAPLTAITNTSLLLNGTDAGVIDKSQSFKTITLNGNVKSSTTQSKFLTSSMYFDGTGDYIAFTSDLYGWTGDFTIEAWVYHTYFSQYSNAIYTTGAASSLGADFFELGANSGGAYQVFWAAGSPLLVAPSSHAVPVNTWSHVALTRSGSALRLYLNGSLSASTTKSGALPSSTTDRSFIGTQAYAAGASSRSFYGYMSDVRLTKGLARYTAADETANIPSAALEG